MTPPSLSKLGTQFPDNLHDAKLIDAAIANGCRLPFRVSPDTGVRGATDDDVGLADYVTLSFRLFGHRLLGLYLFYFVVFISSVGIFLATFHRLARALVLLLAVCGAHVYVLGSNIFDPNYLGSLTDPRFLSVLGIVPGLHLACVLLFRLPLSRGNVAGAIAQSVIFSFVVSVRASAIWGAVAIVALGVVLLFSELWARKKLAPGSWGLAVLLTVGLVYTVHLSRSLHPVYKTDGALGYHGLWHALFYQFQQNRDWEEKYAASYGNAVGDMLPQMAAQKYVLQHPPSPSEDIYLTPDHTLMKPRARETYIRKAFLEFVANDPKFVIATFAGNVGRAGTVLMSFLRSLGRHPFQLSLIVAGAFMAGAAILASDAAGRRILAQAPLLLTGGFLVSLLPNLVSVQGIKLMSDPCLMLLASLIAWIVFGATEALRWAQTRFSHSGLSENPPFHTARWRRWLPPSVSACARQECSSNSRQSSGTLPMSTAASAAGRGACATEPPAQLGDPSRQLGDRHPLPRQVHCQKARHTKIDEPLDDARKIGGVVERAVPPLAVNRNRLPRQGAPDHVAHEPYVGAAQRLTGTESVAEAQADHGEGMALGCDAVMVLGCGLVHALDIHRVKRLRLRDRALRDAPVLVS